MSPTKKLLDDVNALNQLIPQAHSEDSYKILEGWIFEIRGRLENIAIKRGFLTLDENYKEAVRVFNEEVIYNTAMNGELFHYLKPEATNTFNYR